MKRFAMGLLWALLGYGAAAMLGYFLVATLSSNTHDRALEAAMTAAFVFGPIGAVIGFIVGFVRAGKRPGAQQR